MVSLNQYIKTPAKHTQEMLNELLGNVEGNEVQVLSNEHEINRIYQNLAHRLSSIVLQATSSTMHAPLMGEFARNWILENEVRWRESYLRTQSDILEKYLLCEFGAKKINEISKTEILSFRSNLPKVADQKGKKISAKRINAVLGVLRQILNDAADRYGFESPYQNIKPLKIQKSHVEPFSVDEVNKIITNVRKDFKNYFIVRFFTGMRTGEVDGLKWRYIDFENRLILIRETIVAGKENYTKNDSSQREIQMSQAVFDALKAQKQCTKHKSKFVFCNRSGNPLDHVNIAKRVWYPLLEYLGLRKRRPYQTRHTTATMWLAAGENPEWIAQQMGHNSSEMLFRVYSRYVPNLTRQDGTAFERLLTKNFRYGM